LKDIIAVKLGGSIITNKRKPWSVNKEVLERLCSELAESGKRVIVIHGGGSFGHPLAIKYQLAEKIVKGKEWSGMVHEVRKAMLILNDIVVKALENAGINVFSLQPSSFVVMDKGEVTYFDVTVIKRVLEMGLTPVLFGDVVLDVSYGFSIISGDKILVNVVRDLNIKRAIFVTDVDGIFLYKEDERRRILIDNISIDELRDLVKLLRQEPSDATGGIIGKLQSLMLLKGTSCKEVLIINGGVPDLLRKALIGESVKGTRIII